MAGAASLACLLQAPVRQGYVSDRIATVVMRTGTSAGRPGSHLTIASRPLEPRSNLARRLRPATLGPKGPEPDDWEGSAAYREAPVA